MKRIALLLSVVLSVAPLLAQNVVGNIVGTVKDATGAVVPEAQVTLTNEATGVEFKTTTNATGDYVAPNLPPGVYTVKTEFTGFRQSLTRGVQLPVHRTVRVDVALEPGTLTQTVEVEASAPVVASENATIGNVIEGRVIALMPFNGRTLDRLLRISAGVVSDSASNPRVAGSSYWGGIHFNVDGIAYNDSGNGGGAYSFRNGLATFPSIDSIAEFKIDSNNQKAEYEGSASVTMVTKSGANDLHGSALYFNRNRAYAAKNFFATGIAKPPFNRNEYGFTVGGPIRRNKTFFFGDYEALRERFSRTNTLSVPTAAMRAGDFSGLPVIVDPLSAQRTPFPDNRVLDSRIDPRTKTLLGFVPLPNLAGTGPAGTINNYIVTVGNVSDINRYGARLDHNFSDRDRLWGNFNYSKGFPYFVAQAFPRTYGNWSNGGYQTESFNLTYTHTFSPRTLNEARFGWLYHAGVRQGMNLDYNPQQLFPDLYGPLPLGGLPNINVTGLVSIGDYGGSDKGKQYTNQYVDNLTLIRGRHAWKMGIDFANYRVSSPPGAFGTGTNIAQNAAFGRFDFNGRFTNNAGAATPGQPAHAFADFLLGYPNFTYRSTASAINLFYQTRYSAYIQDDWQVSPRLTLNFGVRYMVQTSWKERDGAMANLDLATSKLVVAGSQFPQQAQARLVSAYPVVTSTQFEQAIDTDKNNFAPRVGFAWRPFGNARTVVRGGAGFFYNTIPVYIGVRQLVLLNPPFLLSETFESAPGATPSLTLARPFPGGGTVSANPGIQAVERDLLNSVSQQWNLTAERELARNIGLRVSYVGNKTSHLPWYNRSINVPERQAAGALQPRRPYQPWADILLLSTGADSTLHQLQIEADRRFSAGLAFQAHYAWTRSIDNVPIVGGPQDPYNNRADRGNSDQIRRHILGVGYSYELPFGPGKRFANVAGPAGKILGGWQVAGLTNLRTGPPFSVSFSATLPGWFSSRADVIRDPKLPRGERSLTRWFDPTAFVVPAPFTYGNSARNILFVPGEIVFDVAILKDTPITERVKTQFRAEFFNMPNHANFGGPGASISVPGSVGRITSAGDPRQIQFGLKLLF